MMDDKSSGLRLRNGFEGEVSADAFDQQTPEQQLALFRLIFDSIYNGAIVTDARGRIILFNKPYGEFLGIDPGAQIGKHTLEVVENSRMHIVAKTGKPEINVAHKLKGQEMVVQRIPIEQDGKVIGVFGQVMFKSVDDVSKLAKKLCLLESKVKHYEQELLSLRSTRYTFESIVGVSAAIQNLKREALRAAGTDFPILITGESGTGKEMFAHAIHSTSPRKLGPFIRINCAAIPRELLESELFGYEKGAFTGANPQGKPGKLELADGGTVFLDEIGDMPIEMQPKLLRVLEEKEFEHVGGKRPIQSDFRFITASNQNLEALVSEGKFRKDLFYRLNVIRLRVPPLRERRDDILPIASHLLQSLAGDTPYGEIKIYPQAEQALINYDWPGNVRELYNILSRMVCFLEKDTIHVYDLPFFIRDLQIKETEAALPPLNRVLFCTEKEAILNALSSTGSKTDASKILGIHRTHLYKKMRKYGISP